MQKQYTPLFFFGWHLIKYHEVLSVVYEQWGGQYIFYHNQTDWSVYAQIGAVLCAYFNSTEIKFTDAKLRNSIIAYLKTETIRTTVDSRQWYFCKRYWSGALISYLERGQPIGSSFLCVHAQLWPARRYGHLNLGLAKLHALELPHLRILQD